MHTTTHIDERLDKNFKIIMTDTRYKKEKTKSGRDKWVQVETETKEITIKAYNNMLNAQSWFRNLGARYDFTYNFTIAGYLPIRINNISPGKDEKVVTEFDIKRKEEN